MAIEQVINSVIEGDCLEVMTGFPDACIDMVLCDLPYGITVNPWDCVIDFNRLWPLYQRIIKPNGVIVLTGSGMFTAALIMSNPRWFKYKIVWIKSKSTNFLNAKKQPLRKHEDICVFYQRQPDYHPQLFAGEPYNKGWRKAQRTGSYGIFSPSLAISDGNRYPHDIICYDEADADDWYYCKTCEHERIVYHPTQKPVELGRYLIRTYTKENDIVLDNACGSGSFLVAAIEENRRFIGIERNQQVFYKKVQPIDLVEVCRQRIHAAVTQRK